MTSGKSDTGQEFFRELLNRVDKVWQEIERITDPTVFNRSTPAAQEAEEKLLRLCKSIQAVVQRDRRLPRAVGCQNRRFGKLLDGLEYLFGRGGCDCGEVGNLIGNMRDDPELRHRNVPNWHRLASDVLNLRDSIQDAYEESRGTPEWEPPISELAAFKQIQPMEEAELVKAGFNCFVARSAQARRAATAGLYMLKEKGPILLVGPSGCGKEMFVRDLAAIQKKNLEVGYKATVPPTMACGEFSQDVAWSTFVGTQKGAATGVDARAGLLRGAEDGVLVLDEFHAVPPGRQQDLLRILDIDSPDFAPVGWEKERIPVEAKIIACTSENLWQMVSEGRFSKPLMNRFAGRVIWIPPLYKRPEDIKALIQRELNNDPKIPYSEPELEMVANSVVDRRWHGRRLVNRLRQQRSRQQSLRGCLSLSGMFREFPELLTADRLRQNCISLLKKHQGNVAAAASEFYSDDDAKPKTRRMRMQRQLTKLNIDPKQFKP